jgi:pimeloyl-ACP methyl ester carboxylesterase
MTGASVVILPAAGSAGTVWEPVATRLGATVLPLPDAPAVPAMADALRPAVVTIAESGDAPLVLVGSSLGAMVALELARTLQVHALVLVAAGFGIPVAQAVLDRIAAGGPDLLAQMARGIVAAPDDETLVAAIEADFAARGAPVLERHMRALAAHRPEPPAAPPPTVVLCGVHDPGVPLAAHAELALRCGGLLVPIPAAGHMPYFEQPEQTARWIAWASNGGLHREERDT